MWDAQLTIWTGHLIHNGIAAIVTEVDAVSGLKVAEGAPCHAMDRVQDRNTAAVMTA